MSSEKKEVGGGEDSEKKVVGKASADESCGILSRSCCYLMHECLFRSESHVLYFSALKQNVYT